MTATTDRIETPTGQFLGRWEPGSEPWQAARTAGVGGSEIAAVLGLSKWESRFSLWHRKQGRLPALDLSEEMEAGARFEDAIAGKFADSHPELYVLPAGTFTHTDRPWQIANPDRLLYHVDLGVSEMPVAALEVKFALYTDEWGPAGTDEIPPYYLTQCRWYLDTLGLDTCHLQVFFGSSAEFREYQVHTDPGDQRMLRDAARAFLDTIAAGDRPDIDSHSQTYEAVRHLNPDIDDRDVELDTATVTAYIDAQRGLKQAKEAKTQAAAMVLDAMGDARRALYQGRRIAYRKPGRDGRPPYLSVVSGLSDKEL